MTETCDHPRTVQVTRYGVPIGRKCTTCSARLPLTDDQPTEVTGL